MIVEPPGWDLTPNSEIGLVAGDRKYRCEPEAKEKEKKEKKKQKKQSPESC